MNTVPKQMYYCNEVCTVVTELDDNEVVIDLVIGGLEVAGGYDEPPYFEPLIRRLIVSKKYLTENKVDLEAPLAEVQKQVCKLEREAELRIKAKEKAFEDKIASLKERVSGHKDFEKLLNLFEGKLNWAVVKSRYDNELRIVDLSTVRRQGGRESAELKAIILRREDADATSKIARIKMILAEYNDGSGSENDEIEAFETEQEAVNYFSDVISRKQPDRVTRKELETAREYELDSLPSVVAAREYRRKRKFDSIQKRIQEQENLLSNLREEAKSYE